jgi:hypothetical protein
MTHLLGYADNTALMSRSTAAFKELFLALARDVRIPGLQTKEAKTKYLMSLPPGTKGKKKL